MESASEKVSRKAIDLDGDLADLRRRIQDSTLPSEARAEMCSTVERLLVTLEKLHSADEELSQQNAKLAAAQVELDEERRRYRDLFEEAPDAYLITDERAVVREANHAAAVMLRVPGAFLPGEPLAQFVAVDERGTFRSAVLQMRGVSRMELNHTLVPRSGGEIAAAVTISADRRADGAPVALRWTIRDVTEKQRAERQVRELNAELESRVAERTRQLEAANRTKDQFISALSHELRTPLTPVLATVTTLLRAADVDPALKPLLEMVRRNIELESALIDDLLDITHMERKKIRLNIQRTDVHTALLHALQTCDAEIVRKSISVSTRLDAADHHVQGDFARLHQIFWNLFGNAVKFTPEAGSLLVQTRNEPGDLRGSRIVIDIIDNGIGIAPELLPRLFDAFEQGTSSVGLRFSGLGLGLTIARALVIAHNGKLRAASPGVGQGSTFSVELQTEASEAPPAEPGPSASAAPDRRLRILLVEDHPDTARAMSRLLKSIGHEVNLADRVESALALAANHTFDLIISDIGLPGGSGLDLMRQLRARRPITGIALSGFGTDADVKECREAGFAAHLTKPIDFQKLHALIAKVT